MIWDPGLLETACRNLLNFGEALMRDGITRTINGHLDSDPLCLGASVREEFIEPSAGPNALPRIGQP